MGNCFSDVKATAYAVGDAQGQSVLAPGATERANAADAVACLTGSAEFTSMVEIRISCSNLIKKDKLSQSDAVAVLYEVRPNTSERELGRTEMVANNANPTFLTAIQSVYNFERVQRLRLLVIDLDEGQSPEKVNPLACDFLGQATFSLSEAVTSKDGRLQLKLDTRSSHQSTATISVEEQSNAREVITMILGGVSLTNVELLSKSDPYVEIHKLSQGDGGPGTQWRPVFKSEVKQNNLNPVWNPITIKATQLNNGDAYRPLLLKVFDYDSAGSPKPMGQVQVTAQKLEDAAKSGALLPLAFPSGKPAGSIRVQSYKVAVESTFLDYIRAGAEISFMVAVDFTLSNKPPSDPYSLHYCNPNGGLTPYELALSGVGRVLEFYDTDRAYPAVGFGGIRGTGAVNHCFPLNDRQDAICYGVDGIMQAYRQALSQWRLSGPTLFTPVLRMAGNVAAHPTPHLKYNVLLILTDGEIMDMPETIETLVAASQLPLSVLIVGIGNAEFAAMEALDGDKTKLRSGNAVAARDIVQFVEFNKFSRDSEALAAALLEELPGQFLAHVRALNIPVPVAHQQPPPQAL